MQQEPIQNKFWIEFLYTQLQLSKGRHSNIFCSFIFLSKVKLKVNSQLEIFSIAKGQTTETLWCSYMLKMVKVKQNINAIQCHDNVLANFWIRYWQACTKIQVQKIFTQCSRIIVSCIIIAFLALLLTLSLDDQSIRR